MISQNQNGLKSPEKNPGSFSIDENKIRVKNLKGQTSVLFEDISSITWEKIAIPNVLLITIGVFLIFFGPMYALTFAAKNNSDDSSLNFIMIFIIIVAIGMIISGIVNKKKWEDVVVETRGGLLLRYSVEDGLAESEVNKIEHARRSFLK